MFVFFFQAEDGIRDLIVTGVQTCALPICSSNSFPFCQTEIAAPSSPNFSKFSRNSGSRQERSSSACNCIKQTWRDDLCVVHIFFGRESPRRPSRRSDQFLDRLEIGICLRDVAKRWIHFETGEQMDLGRFRISEKRIVAAHVVIINWLPQQRGQPFHKKFLGLRSFPEFVQTETSMKKSSAAVRRDLAKLAADRQGALPHQVMESQL